MTNNQKLPELSSYEDKRITEGLKFITGGAGYSKTEGGTLNMPDGSGTKDFVGDAIYRDSDGNPAQIFGMCSNHASSDEFYKSEVFRDWLNSYGLE